jgi:serine protease AprX
MAPGAKIAFVDIGDSTTALSVPDDLSQLFNWTYSLGAYIHSDSWGSTGNYYSLGSYEIDNFQWQHKDFLNVRAAGNDGEFGDRTILSEANAKNSLVIGNPLPNITNIFRIFFYFYGRLPRLFYKFCAFS